MNLADVLHHLIDGDLGGHMRDDAHAAVDAAVSPQAAATDSALEVITNLGNTATVTGERATHMIDGVERFVDDGTPVPSGDAAAEEVGETVEGDAATGDGAESVNAEEEADPSLADSGDQTSPTPGSGNGDPLNPTIESVFDGKGNVVGHIDSTTGLFTPLAS